MILIFSRRITSHAGPFFFDANEERATKVDTCSGKKQAYKYQQVSVSFQKINISDLEGNE